MTSALGRLRRVRTLTVAAVLLASLHASAERDSFGFGTGRDGTLTLSVPTVVNNDTQLDSQTSATELVVADASGFHAGGLVLLVIMQAVGGDAGTPGPDSLAGLDLGYY